MKLYKLKHKPTGLYYIPSRGRGNLSKKGKVYVERKPSINWALTLRIVIYIWNDSPKGIHKIIVDYFNLNYNAWKIDEHVKTKREDWEIEEVS